MVAVSFILAGLVIVAALAGLVIYRAMHEQRQKALLMPRRSFELEARIKTVLTGPRQKYGEIFTDYAVWKSETETRLELVAGDPWKRLNEFTRCLIVRYLWRVLESLAGGAVVIVDEPQQLWNEEVDSGFRDQGFDWKTFGNGPQFINET
jgi:hypothetical protein